MAQPTPNAKSLASSLCNLANANCRMIAEIRYSEDSEDATMDSHLRHELNPQKPITSEDQKPVTGSVARDSRAISGTFSELLYGLDRLSQLDGGLATEGRVIHSCIKLFQCVLDRICCLSIADAKKPRNPNDQHQNKDKRNRSLKTMPKCLTCRKRHLKCDQRALECRNCKHKNIQCDRALSPAIPVEEPSKPTPENLDERIINLCQLAISMMKCLNPAKTSHGQILEGFVFVLFEKVGKGLRKIIFGSAEGGECTTIPGGNPCNNEESSSSQPASHVNNDDQAEDAVAAAIEHQAPYLIWILERVQSILSHQQQQGPTAITFSSSSPHHPSPPNNNENLAAFAREKLQYTLLKAVFGDRAPTTQDYEPALRKALPPAPSPPADAAATDEFPTIEIPPGEDVRSWYKREVWRLLGWDVLMKHGWRGKGIYE